jgi:hypothetical protein
MEIMTLLQGRKLASPMIAASTYENYDMRYRQRVQQANHATFNNSQLLGAESIT